MSEDWVKPAIVGNCLVAALAPQGELFGRIFVFVITLFISVLFISLIQRFTG